MTGSDSGDRYRYTGANAEVYGSFGIDGTTYQIGFEAVAELLGDISGKTFLDFGCGAGRSARFLKRLGARQVYAVDHDQNMIDQSLAQGLDGVTFLRANGVVPLPDTSADGAVSCLVSVDGAARGARAAARSRGRYGDSGPRGHAGWWRAGPRRGA